MYHIASCDFAGSQKKLPSYVFAVPLSETKCVVNRMNALLSDHTYRVSIRFIPSPILLASAVQTPPTSHDNSEIGFKGLRPALLTGSAPEGIDAFLASTASTATFPACEAL